MYFFSVFSISKNVCAIWDVNYNIIWLAFILHYGNDPVFKR